MIRTRFQWMVFLFACIVLLVIGVAVDDPLGLNRAVPLVEADPEASTIERAAGGLMGLFFCGGIQLVFVGVGLAGGAIAWLLVRAIGLWRHRRRTSVETAADGNGPTTTGPWLAQVATVALLAVAAFGLLSFGSCGDDGPPVGAAFGSGVLIWFATAEWIRVAVSVARRDVDA